MINKLEFRPLFGLSSPHLQTILAQYGPVGNPPPSAPLLVHLSDGDMLCCEVSTPEIPAAYPVTVVMVHGLGGSHESGYLIRMARQYYNDGFEVVRVNLRGSGSGKDLASRPYNGGTSDDVLAVLKVLKERKPAAQIILLGFSMGGNISLKLGGELGHEGKKFISCIIAVCPTIRLYHSILMISKKTNWIYHRFYLKSLIAQCAKWIGNMEFASLYEYDDKVTAPLWGFRNAMEYYDICSSYHYIKGIEVPCRMLFAEDDPFIDYHVLDGVDLPDNVKIYVTRYGGHMGFLGWTGSLHSFYWMDHLLTAWVREIASDLDAGVV